MYSLFCCKELNTFPLYNGGRYENKSSSENTHANPGKTIEPKQTMAGKMTIDDVVRDIYENHEKVFLSYRQKVSTFPAYRYYIFKFP